MGLALFHELPRLLTFRSKAAEVAGNEGTAATEHWGPFVRMIGVVTVRSFVHFGLVTFVSSYYIQVLGSSPLLASAALSVMLFAGGVGTLVGGPLADRFGRRAVLAGSMFLLSPLIYAFTLSGALPGMVFLAFVGAATIGTFGVTVVMGQEYLPGRIGVAAGVTMGLSIGLGGAGAPILGAVADNYGLPATMLAISTLPLVGLALALSLPRERPEPVGSGA
jgi:FSR family fosmidomycin resistance protein-like MFS transporter